MSALPATAIHVAIVVAMLALPLGVLAQGPSAPSGDVELKARKKTTVVHPKPVPGQAPKDAAAVEKKAGTKKRLDEATKPAPPARPDLDPSVSGGIQTKSLRRETTK